MGIRSSGLRTRLSGERGLIIAPLLDIMFMVLLFFVFNVQFSSVESFNITLPKSSKADGAPQGPMLTVSVDDTGRYEINGNPVDAGQIIAELSKELTDSKDKSVLLLGSKNIGYGVLVNTIDMIKSAGAEGISLGVDKDS